MDFDSKMKHFFSERTELPSDVRAKTFALLREAEESENLSAASPRLIWGIVAFDLVISIGLLYAVWAIFGQGILAYAATWLIGITMVVAVALAAVRSLEGGIQWSGSLAE
ncbi:MAG: hypothetical protein FWF81_07385 [Defluviitaleaceae bacterium]|nr:hypothetical protein [Defluviitaleaceae bacterium]